MIESKIEKIVLDKFKEELGEELVQFIGVWQVEDDKGAEDGEKDAVLAVKVYPRSYDTPTIPDSQIQVDISLVVRADTDFTGVNYLELTSKVSDVLQLWQSSFEASHLEFTIENEFNETGFQLNGGGAGIDKEKKIWQFNQSFTIYGIIQ